MLKVVLLTVLQCLLLSGGQVCFKLAVERIDKFSFAWRWFLDLLTNWWLLASGITLIAATLLWGYILKHFDFSLAYPVTAFSYVFGMLAALLIFHENISLLRWAGVGFIVLGVILIAK